jgi:repressor LexA
MLYKLKNIRKASGYTQKGMADALGIPLGTYRNWEQCIYAPQDIEMLKKIADTLHTSMESLLGYDAVLPGYISENVDDHFVYVPLFGRIAAGEPLYMDKVDNHVLTPKELTRKYPHAFFLTIDGESMNRVLPNGCYALVNPDEKQIIDGVAYAVCVNGYDATVKRVRQLENGVELVPDSTDPTFHPMVYDHTVAGTESITIIGRVVWYTVPFDFEI